MNEWKIIGHSGWYTDRRPGHAYCFPEGIPAMELGERAADAIRAERRGSQSERMFKGLLDERVRRGIARNIEGSRGVLMDSYAAQAEIRAAERAA